MNQAQMMIPRRFGMLRVVGTLLKVLAWLALIAGVVGAVLLLVAGGMLVESLTASGIASPLGGSEAIILAIGGLLFGVIYFLALYAAGEGLFLQLAVEENTRLTAALLLQKSQESPAQPRYPADGPL